VTGHLTGRPHGEETFATLSHVVLDVLVGAPGASAGTPMLGGAGLYAALGLRMATPARVVPCSGVGRDLFDEGRELFAAWDISADGLTARSDCTPRTLITYSPDGARSERSLLGDAHFAAHRPDVADLGPSRSSLAGLYTFQNADPATWADIIALRRPTGCPVLWELSATERGADGWARVAAIAAAVDVVSVNVDEGLGLLGTDDPARIARALVDAGAPVAVVRAGARGSAVADAATTLRVGSAPVGAIVDPTGAGNTYSGAFLAAWAHSGSLESAARTAAAAASFALEQTGPPARPPRQELVAARAARTQVTPIAGGGLPGHRRMKIRT
jgi:sugar/nucleoside kinase (ribokinase family)